MVVEGAMAGGISTTDQTLHIGLVKKALQTAVVRVDIRGSTMQGMEAVE